MPRLPQASKVVAIRSRLILALLLGCGSSHASSARQADPQSLAFRLRLEAGPMVSAHRGGPEDGYPENALSTLRHTFERGVRMLEVDVRRTADGILVLMHDETLDRTTTGRGPLVDATSSQLRSIRLLDGDGRQTDQGVPTLDAALRWACSAGAILTLDVKEGVPYEAVVNAIRLRRADECAVIIVYDTVGYLRVRGLDPEVFISVSVSTVAHARELIQTGDPNILAFVGSIDSVAELDLALLSEFADAGLRTAAGTFRLDETAYDAGPYEELFAAGLGLLVSDRPDLAQAACR